MTRKEYTGQVIISANSYSRRKGQLRGKTCHLSVRTGFGKQASAFVDIDDSKKGVSWLYSRDVVGKEITEMHACWRK